jgi:catechol 2,3-dioxygenase-like lactoylglutathione lyase family enzyme
MAIFTHVVVGSNDLERSRRFYDATLAALGLNYIGPMGERAHMYGAGQPEFMVTRPRNGQPACFANGGTIGFAAPSRAAVDQFHAAALANGGSDEGQPGPRPFPPNAYGAYVRDPDGNKLTAYCFTPG